MTAEPNWDAPLSTAAVDLIGRTGATGVEVAFDDDVDPPRFNASARYQGTRVIVEGHTGPDTALNALAMRLVHGGRCTGCGKITALSDDPIPVSAILGEGGGTFDPEVEQARGVCRWTLTGARWTRGCGPDAPGGSSRERLARALAEAGAPTEAIAHAREGRWDEYLSPHAFPLMLAVDEFRKNGLGAIADRVIAGEFDAPAEEGNAWAASDEGRQAFAELTAGGPPVMNRRERRAARGRRNR